MLGWRRTGKTVTGPRGFAVIAKAISARFTTFVRTADGGGDARGKYRWDDLMPDLFAGPYVFLAPVRLRA